MQSIDLALKANHACKAVWEREEINDRGAGPNCLETGSKRLFKYTYMFVYMYVYVCMYICVYVYTYILDIYVIYIGPKL